MRSAISAYLIFAAASASFASEQADSRNPPPPPADAVRTGRPTCLVVPVKGIIGSDTTAAGMKAWLEEAQKLQPTLVVLEIDTPGGNVTDAERIVDMLITHKKLRIVAFVRKALSAGAAIALACSEIYVTETATIGAAVSYFVGPDGKPVELQADVAEKFQSVWRATCRKAAESGAHPTLLAEAMADRDFGLTMRREGERVVIERDGQGQVLKPKGRILTLTAGEAISCQLARAKIVDLAALCAHLSLTDCQVLGVIGPAKPSPTPLRSAKELFTDLPAELTPYPDFGWIPTQQKVLTAWLTDRFKGQSMLWEGTYSGTATTVVRGGLDVRLYIEPVECEVVKGTKCVVHCGAVFPAGSARLRKLQVGAPIRFLGIVDSICCYEDGELVIDLWECALARTDPEAKD